MAQFPTSLPIHPRVRQTLHELRVEDISASYGDTRRQLYETLQSLLADPDDAIEDQMNALISNYRQLRSLQTSSNTLTTRLEKAKDAYRQASEQCAPVDPLTWYQYSSGELAGPTSLSTFFQNEQATSQEAPQVSRDDLLLSALQYVWADPTAIIPDEQNDEDDLCINGGKIELHCPITFSRFKNPMISKKCNHVFDLVGIESYLGGLPTRDCPQSGCSQKLKISDFQPDELMKLRCRIAEVKKRFLKSETAFDVI